MSVSCFCRRLTCRQLRGNIGFLRPCRWFSMPAAAIDRLHQIAASMARPLPSTRARRSTASSLTCDMDEALRYNQHLQFCKQLATLQQQLCEDTALSDDLLASLHALGKYSATPASCLSQLAEAFPEFAAKLQKSFKQHPIKELHVEQTEREAVEAVVSNAESLMGMLQPIYRELQELGKFIGRSSSLLADLHQLIIPVTMATAPQLIEHFMTLFCNTARLVLLMDRVPWKLLVQVYTIVTFSLDGASPPGRAAVLELLERLDAPVPHLQQLFQPISQRVSQVLELAVSAVLDHAASARALEASAVFDVSRLGQTQLGVTGLSLQATYTFLQRLETFTSWALLGFLACPAALTGVKGQGLLASLLRSSFLLHLYADACLPLHALFQQHVAPALEQQLGTLLDAGASERSTALRDARELVGRCYAAAADGAEAEHAARRRLITRVLRDLLALLQDDASQQPAALPMALAAQSYARSELHWYFRHVGEPLPPPPQPAGGVAAAAAAAGKLVAPLLGAAPAVMPPDAAVVGLVAAFTDLYDLLEAHQDVLQGEQLATMRALLEQQVLPETAAVLAVAERSTQDMPAAGKERVVPRMLVPLVKGAVYPMAQLCGAEDATGLLDSMQASQQHQQDDEAAAAGTQALHSAADAVAMLQSAQRQMMHLTMLLSSRNLWMRPAVLEAPAQDPQYLEAIHKVLELCPYALCFSDALAAACCLGQLVHYQGKLLQLQAAVLGANTLAAREAMACCPSLVKVLAWFEHNAPVVDATGEAPRDYAAEAQALACQLLEEQCGTVAWLLAGFTWELRGGLAVKHAPDAQVHLKGRPGSVPAAASDTDAMPARDNEPRRRGLPAAPGGIAAGAAAAGGAAHASMRSRALALAGALDAVGPVRVSSEQVVVPVEYLRVALQQWLLLQVNELVGLDEVPPVPSQLARTLQDLLWAVSCLQQVLSIDVRPDLWQVLLNHVQPDWVVPPLLESAMPAASSGWLQHPDSAAIGRDAAALSDGGDAAAGDAAAAAEVASTCASTAAAAAAGGGAASELSLNSIVLAYAEWYLQHVVRDVKGLGVLYAPQLRCFTCVAGSAGAIEARASLAEVTALLQMLGPYAAQTLAELSEGVVLSCLGQLDGCLVRWKELLDPVTMAVVRDDCCADAVAAALRGLADEGAVLTQARQLSRALAFRQLLGEAAAQALQGTLPVAAATVGAVAGNAALDACGAGGAEGLVPERHVCDVLELPRPGLQGIGSPAAADPVVVSALVGSNNYERYKAWFNLPALLGLCLNSPSIGPSTACLVQRALANELHALVHTAKCLMLAQQAAADRVLTCGSRFLHPEVPGQAADMLAGFSKVAATTLYLRNDATAVRTCKQLLLDGLGCPQLPGSKLADAWLPATRVRSALCQAVL